MASTKRRKRARTNHHPYKHIDVIDIDGGGDLVLKVGTELPQIIRAKFGHNDDDLLWLPFQLELWAVGTIENNAESRGGNA